MHVLETLGKPLVQPKADFREWRVLVLSYSLIIEVAKDQGSASPSKEEGEGPASPNKAVAKVQGPASPSKNEAEKAKARLWWYLRWAAWAAIWLRVFLSLMFALAAVLRGEHLLQAMVVRVVGYVGCHLVQGVVSLMYDLAAVLCGEHLLQAVVVRVVGFVGCHSAQRVLP